VYHHHHHHQQNSILLGGGISCKVYDYSKNDFLEYIERAMGKSLSPLLHSLILCIDREEDTTEHVFA
jgi:hypothetical protein